MHKTYYYILIASLLISAKSLCAQDFDEEEKKSYDGLIEKIEKLYKYKVYFKHQDLQGFEFDDEYKGHNLDSLLQYSLSPQGLYYVIHDSSVFITKEKRIVTEFSFDGNSINSDSAQVPPGLIFKNDIETSNNVGQKTFKIGSQAKFQSNTKSILTGTIKDKKDSLISDALIYTDDFKYSSSSDSSGNYVIALESGEQNIIVQRLGYLPLNLKLIMYSDGQLDLIMKEDVITLNEVKVVSTGTKNVNEPLMGVEKMTVEQVKNLPLVLGEKDIIKVATSYAGIQKVGEAAAGFNVRGGKSDQNLILFDGNTLYNSNHFFGFFSAFNSDILQSLDVYKGSIPSRYGGRLSSVFNIQSKTPNLKKLNFEAGLSPVTSKVKAEIPLIKEKAGLLIGGRATYSNWILKRINNVDFNQNEVSFRDFNLGYFQKLNKKNNIKLSLYSSNDNFSVASDTLLSFSNFNYSNKLGSFNWSHTIDRSKEFDLNVGVSKYSYLLKNTESDVNAFQQKYSIDDYHFKYLFKNYFSESGIIEIGIETKFYDILPGKKAPLGEQSQITKIEIQKDRGIESAIFAGFSSSPFENLKFDIGLRYSAFQNIGPRKVLVYDQNQPKKNSSIVDSVFYSSNEISKHYHNLNYRLSGSYNFNKNSSIKLSVNKTTQYIHSVSNSASISPTDIWIISSPHIKPQTARQISLGFYKNFSRNIYETNVDIYYKSMENLVDIKTGSSFILNKNLEQVLLQGPGKAYGLELSLKKTGKLNGWINYTYSRSFIKLDGNFSEETINQGIFYRTNYDQPHSFNLVSNYKLTKRVSFSLNTTFRTGRPITYPTGKYTFKDQQYINYGSRNSSRIEDYFRIDLGVNLEEGHKTSKKIHSYWSFSIYNVLGRKNIYSVYFDSKDDELKGYKLSIFNRPIPTLTFNVRFL